MYALKLRTNCMKVLISSKEANRAEMWPKADVHGDLDTIASRTRLEATRSRVTAQPTNVLPVTFYNPLMPATIRLNISGPTLQKIYYVSIAMNRLILFSGENNRCLLHYTPSGKTKVCQF
jgi:hypothetical protein